MLTLVVEGTFDIPERLDNEKMHESSNLDEQRRYQVDESDGLSSLEDHASSLEGATRAMDTSYTAADVL